MNDHELEKLIGDLSRDCRDFTFFTPNNGDDVDQVWVEQVVKDVMGSQEKVGEAPKPSKMSVGRYLGNRRLAILLSILAACLLVKVLTLGYEAFMNSRSMTLIAQAPSPPGGIREPIMQESLQEPMSQRRVEYRESFYVRELHLFLFYNYTGKSMEVKLARGQEELLSGVLKRGQRLVYSLEPKISFASVEVYVDGELQDSKSMTDPSNLALYDEITLKFEGKRSPDPLLPDVETPKRD